MVKKTPLNGKKPQLEPGSSTMEREKEMHTFYDKNKNCSNNINITIDNTVIVAV